MSDLEAGLREQRSRWQHSLIDIENSLRNLDRELGTTVPNYNGLVLKGEMTKLFKVLDKIKQRLQELR